MVRLGWDETEAVAVDVIAPTAAAILDACEERDGAKLRQLADAMREAAETAACVRD